MRLPSPPRELDPTWANALIRSIEQETLSLRQPIGIGYNVQSAAPYKALNSQSGASAEAKVGTVTVSTNGVVNVTVTPSGVGGAYSPPPLSDVARVLATFLADARARGVLG